MPIPTPRKGEAQSDFISRCMSALADTDSDRPQKQRLAICFSKWRSSKGQKERLSDDVYEEMCRI